jgi:hypothetical protein
MKGVEFLIGSRIWYDDKEIEIEELTNREYIGRKAFKENRRGIEAGKKQHEARKLAGKSVLY